MENNKQRILNIRIFFLRLRNFIIGVPERKECNEAIIKEEMTKRFPKSTKGIKSQIEKVLTPLKDQLNKHIHR